MNNGEIISYWMAQIRVKPDIEQIVQRYVHHLQKELRFQNVFVYGSFANGHPTEDSDIDVAIISDDFTGDPIEDRLRLMKIRRKVDTRIEPHPFNSRDFAPDHPHAKEILEHGYEIIPRSVH